MAENLRITTPVTAGDHTAHVKGNKTPTPIGNIDPTRVLAKDPKAQKQDSGTSLQWNNNSVFQSFIGKLKETQSLSLTLGKLLNGAMTEINSASAESVTGQVLSELAQSTVMNEEQMLENLLFQQQNSTKFNSEIFDLFRVLAKSGSSARLNECIGRFLKAYDGYFGSQQTMGTIKNQLEAILQYIPKSFRVPIEEAINHLQLSDAGVLFTENAEINPQQLNNANTANSSNEYSCSLA